MLLHSITGVDPQKVGRLGEPHWAIGNSNRGLNQLRQVIAAL